MEHGKRTTYAKHGCRCDLCRTAEREQKRKYRATEKGKESMRRVQRHQTQMRRLALVWIRENRPDVYKELRRKVFCD